MSLPAPLQLLLTPFSLLYRLVITLRNRAYDWGLLRSHALPSSVKVVSIGNLSTGGTGKTPMAEYLIREALDRGLRVAYLSRGYGRATKGYLRIQPNRTRPQDSGDEALQVACKFPSVAVAVCENRVEGAFNLLAERELDLLVLDDAFQHRRIQRDVNVVLVDANRPPWQDRLLPAGHLREPLSSLKRADLVVVNKMTQRRTIQQFRNRIRRPVCFTRMTPYQMVPCLPHVDLITLDQLKLRTCLSFSGLGNNEAFLNELKGLGLNVVRHFEFPDHHFYGANDLRGIAARYRKLTKQSDIFTAQPIIITTEKDFIRLKGQDWFPLQFSQIPIYYLEIKLEVLEGEAMLWEQLAPALRKRHADLHTAAV